MYIQSRKIELKPFTIDELDERIEKSLSDSKNDRVTENSQLIEEIKKWN